MNILKTGKGIQIIDDTYNANPGSMEAAIKTLKSLKGKRRGILISGDMLELGEHAESMHREMGSKAAGSGIAKDLCNRRIRRKCRDRCIGRTYGFQGYFRTREEIIEDIIDRLDAGDWILVKGSRGMAMEKIVEGLLRLGRQLK